LRLALLPFLAALVGSCLRAIVFVFLLLLAFYLLLSNVVVSFGGLWKEQSNLLFFHVV
jgi:hypothetical protein